MGGYDMLPREGCPPFDPEHGNMATVAAAAGSSRPSGMLFNYRSLSYLADRYHVNWDC